MFQTFNLHSLLRNFLIEYYLKFEFKYILHISEMYLFNDSHTIIQYSIMTAIHINTHLYHVQIYYTVCNFN